MKTVQDVQRLITHRLEKHWADSVLAEARNDVDPRWPWTVTLTSLSGQTLNDQWSDVWRWILAWNAWVEANGCTLTVANRRVGGPTRSIPTRVAIPDIATAAAASDADWPQRLDAARRRARVLHDEFPETLTSGLLRGAAQLSDVDFDLARAAAAWFRQHNAAGLTPPDKSPSQDFTPSGSTGTCASLPVSPGGRSSGSSLVPRGSTSATSMEAGSDRATDVATRPRRTAPAPRLSAASDPDHREQGLSPLLPRVHRRHRHRRQWQRRDPTRQDPLDRRMSPHLLLGVTSTHGLAILDRLRSTGIDAESILMDHATLDRYAPYASPTFADGNSLAHRVLQRPRRS